MSNYRADQEKSKKQFLFNPNNPENSFYTRELIQTPYGEAFCYFYNHNLNEKVGTIKHGNWRLHSTTVKRK